MYILNRQAAFSGAAKRVRSTPPEDRNARFLMALSRVSSVRSAQNEALLTVTEAVRLCRLEIECYYDDRCRGTSEDTIKRLIELVCNKTSTPQWRASPAMRTVRLSCRRIAKSGTMRSPTLAPSPPHGPARPATRTRGLECR
jgi:hypothetical protein